MDHTNIFKKADLKDRFELISIAATDIGLLDKSETKTSIEVKGITPFKYDGISHSCEVKICYDKYSGFKADLSLRFAKLDDNDRDRVNLNLDDGANAILNFIDDLKKVIEEYTKDNKIKFE